MFRQSAESIPTISRLRGMPDIAGPTLLERAELEHRINTLLSSYGYCAIDTPLLEPTELFLRKSGGELASQLFSFVDPISRSVSLRPEFTAPVMRHYLEHAHEIDLPARRQYCGAVFRFDGPPDANDDDAPISHQFTQIGGELIGSSNEIADVELLDLALSVVTEAGLTNWTMRLADLDILNGLLDPLSLSDRARAFVVQSVPQLAEGPSQIRELMDQARRLHLVGRQSDGDYLSQAVDGLDDDEARNVLLGILRSNSLDQIGQRKPEDVVERLLRKIRRPDTEQTLLLALEKACELAQVRGVPAHALETATRILLGAGANENTAKRLMNVVNLLPAPADSVGQVVLDFGLVRGLSYYNGMIFEVSHPLWPSPIGGGGRYDGLSRDLGGMNRIPALGFAYNLDALAGLVKAGSVESKRGGRGVLVKPASDAANAAAFNTARNIRYSEGCAEMEVSNLPRDEALVFATRLGFSRLVIVSEDGSLETLDVR